MILGGQTRTRRACWADRLPVPVAPPLLHPLDPPEVVDFLLAGVSPAQAARERALLAVEVEQEQAS